MPNFQIKRMYVQVFTGCTSKSDQPKFVKSSFA